MCTTLEFFQIIFDNSEKHLDRTNLKIRYILKILDIEYVITIYQQHEMESESLKL